MQRFLQQHKSRIVGVLSGFDRVLFRGSLRSMSYVRGMDKFLGAQGVLYKDFKPFAQRVSGRIKEHAEQFAEKHGRPFHYLASSKTSKEQFARKIAESDNIKRGLICVLSCVEPCQTFTVRKNRRAKRLELVPALRKCLFYYFYFLDREFGLMHVRLQTWLPMPIQICINGREYLARRMDRAGIAYEKRENCFTSIADLPRAQRMMQDLEQRNWSHLFDALARRLNPWMSGKDQLDLRGYYWTFRESEYATDIMFSSESALKEIYPSLVDHAIRHFHSRDVLRFLGRRTNVRFSGEVTSDVKHRFEGVRIKHWVEENSIKMYDKQGSVLRIEMTMNNPRRFKVRRMATRNGQTQMAWIPLRKGVADITRRVDISRAANERYLEALGVVGDSSPTRHLMDPVSKRVTRRGRPFRALRPIEPEESRLFATLLSGDFFIQGFRNKDIRRKLFPGQERKAIQRRRASGRVTRLLALLRAHGLIQKVSKTFYYRVTPKGHQVMTSALKLRELDLATLTA